MQAIVQFGAFWLKPAQSFGLILVCCHFMLEGACKHGSVFGFSNHTCGKKSKKKREVPLTGGEPTVFFNGGESSSVFEGFFVTEVCD